jgi:hypothetical protein
MPAHRLLVFAVLLAACSSDASTVSTVATAPTTVATATVGTAAPSSTTTTVPPSTTSTSTAPTTTTTTTLPEVVAPRAAPTVALGSFVWSFSTTIGAEDAELLAVESTGTFVDGSFDCEIVAGFGGFDFSTRLVVIEDRAYYDDGTGSGLTETDPMAPEVLENSSLCAGSTVFWADITGGEALPDGGEREERNDIATRRLDLTGIIDQAGALGLFTPGVEGVAFDQLDFWVAVPGEWINSIEMRASLEPEALGDITGSTVVGNGEIRVNLDITRPGDDSLALTAP